MKHQIESLFNMYIVKTYQNKDIASFLWNHERKPKCVHELCRQIELCERSEKSIKFDRSKYRMVVNESAKMFCGAALLKAEQDAVSRIERQRLMDESNRIKDIEDEFEEDQKEALDDKIISYPTVESL